MQIYTIGHSTHKWETFAKLLNGSGIELLVDVRANPSSRFAPFANKNTLPALLERIGVDYEFMGGMLGGRRSYTAKDRQEFYSKMRGLDEFQDEIGRLVSMASRRKTVVLCSEEDPKDCHRLLLLGPSLEQNGCEVLHIRGDGRVQSTEQIGAGKKYAQQLQGAFTI
ncbi:MAG: DUF488 domain-containing protein [Chloroflexota bacterium]|nr:DUF488 domain-containing protein [Chloroflexota bacterium]